MFLNPEIILLGGGGHCKVIISILKRDYSYKSIGISDLRENIGKYIYQTQILYSDEDLEELYANGVKEAFVSLGSIGNPDQRVRSFEKLKKIGFHIPVIVSKASIIDKTVSIGNGTVIMPGVIINAGSKIGENCIINTGAIIEHDCSIGNHSHIAPGVILSGTVNVGNLTHIGTGTKVIQTIQISERTIIGAGSTIVKNIDEPGLYYGTPAKKASKF